MGYDTSGAQQQRADSQQGGISSPNYQPYSTGPGLQAGTAGNVGYDGNAPGAGEQYAGAALNYYGSGNVPGVSNYQAQNYGQFMQQAPADMSSYYDNAQRQQDNAINTQMAARGSYGSSNAVGQLAAADTNLRAQQARDQAQYGLQRAQVGGALAGGVDQQSNEASRNQLSWTQGLGDLAFKQQQAGMNRYEQGNQDAMQAAGVLSGLEGENYAGATSADANYMDQAMNAYNGYATQNATNQRNDSNRSNQDTKDAVNFGMGVLKSGASAGMA